MQIFKLSKFIFTELCWLIAVIFFSLGNGIGTHIISSTKSGLKPETVVLVLTTIYFIIFGIFSAYKTRNDKNNTFLEYGKTIFQMLIVYVVIYIFLAVSYHIAIIV